jgi:hypothetical protein
VLITNNDPTERQIRMIEEILGIAGVLSAALSLLLSPLFLLLI